MHVLFVVFILIDQVTKTLLAGRDFFVTGLHVHSVRNYALPFGIDFGNEANFYVLILAYVAVGWLLLKSKSVDRRSVVGKSMFLAGAASNLADRLVYGYVRDFLDLGLGFVFNLADVFIIVGLILVLTARPRDLSSPDAPKVEKL